MNSRHYRDVTNLTALLAWAVQPW